MSSALISVASAWAIRGDAMPAPAATIAEFCRNRRLDRCFNMTATSQGRSGEYAAPCYEMSECSLVGLAPRPRRGQTRQVIRCAESAGRGDGAALSQQEGVEADRVFHPDGSGIVSSSPPGWVSERRT